jgi:hypothetical protein
MAFGIKSRNLKKDQFMKWLRLLPIIVLFAGQFGFANEGEKMAGSENSGISVIFATYAEDTSSIGAIIKMVESLRTFGGIYSKAPFWIYISNSKIAESEKLILESGISGIELKTSEAPKESNNFYFSGKTFAAANFEKEALGKADLIIWMDEDTIILQEPKAFALDKGMILGYRPVMHKNIGSLYSEPVDPFWSRIYKLLSVEDSSLFPMATVASDEVLRPYFNAGLLIVRPEFGLLRKWPEYFMILCGDSVLVEMCKQDRKKNIFLHQTALSAAILNLVPRDKMKELPPEYNYPLFFDEMFGAVRPYNSLDNVVTFRHEAYFSRPSPDWEKKIKGPADKIAWIKEHLIK